MKILVLTTSYPQGDSVEAYFVHTRNLYYVEKGMEVTVLNFKTDRTYYKDGIKVISERDFNPQEEYDLFISHAPNLRQHHKFLRKYMNIIPRIIFFFHGHEVMIQSQVYPEPYDFARDSNVVKKFAIDTYDRLKLRIWRNFFIKNREKVEFVFVSEWMKNMFVKFTGIRESDFPGKFNIIYNSVGSKFESAVWNRDSEKEFDVLSIRSNIDGAKYCVDVINALARNNPDLKFRLFGKGSYFQHYEKAANLEFIEKNLSHDEIIDEANKARVALLPTRTDAQGVMACELNIIGIPLITSDIEVCTEVFRDIPNVRTISNDKLSGMKDLDIVINEMEKDYKDYRSNRYLSTNTLEKEIKLFNRLKTR